MPAALLAPLRPTRLALAALLACGLIPLAFADQGDAIDGRATKVR